MTKEDVIKKLQALANVTIENGATQAEVNNALALTHKLTLKYNVSVADLATEKEEITESDVTMGTKSLSPIQVHIAVTLSKHFGVKVLSLQRRDGSESLKVIGEPVKVQSFTSSYTYAYNAFKVMWKNHMKSLNMSTHDKGMYRGQFLKGFTDGITNEYIKNETEYGLVLVSSPALDKYMEENHSCLGRKQSTMSCSSDAHAYAHGYTAGADAIKNKKGIGN